MARERNYEPKELFIQRINSLLDSKADIASFWETVKQPLLKTIRVNTLKISPEDLIKKLKEKDWKISQPYKNNPEIILVENLGPGELGKSREHILGYYYVQETSSMMPILALQPKAEDVVLDLCAAPGSKTTQASALMQNKGIILANDVSLGRISILAANLEKLGCSNVVVSRHDGIQLCHKLKKLNMQFDKILLDVPCSGEGNVRSNPATYKMWNLKVIEKLSRLQRKIAETAVPLLKPGGELIYSTCTHSPEENELNIQYLIDNFPLEILPVSLPLKTRPGLTSWKDERLNPQIKKAVRIYPQDNNTEGFFLCKMRKKP